jgi:lysine 6-dehydrogenase
MKVMILGSGGMGASCASILSRQDNVDEIRLADLKLETAQEMVDKIGSPKIKAYAVNALEPDSVASVAKDVDVLIDMVMPWMVPYVLKGAIKVQCNYINTAFDAPYWDEFLEGKTPDQITLAKEAKDAGITALFGCGFAPGWTNVLARRFANRMDEVDSIKLRIGKANVVDGEGPDDWVLRPWNPGWAPKQALIDCATPTYALEDGKFVAYPPFGGMEPWDFPEPVGNVQVTHHSHEEIYSMPSTFPNAKNIDFKYYLMKQPAIFYAQGLLSDEEIEVNGVKVKPLDVLSALIPAPSSNLFDSSDEALAEADKKAFIELIVEVSGKKDGKNITWKANCPKMNAPGPELKKLYGTNIIYVSLPLAVGTMIVAEENLPKGIIFADQLDPENFIERMMGTGYPYKWKESQI